MESDTALKTKKVLQLVKHEWKICAICLLLLGCQHKSNEQTALVEQRSLIASNEIENLLVAQIDTPLTREDQHRLDRQYPNTLEKIYKNQKLQSRDIIHLTRSGVADSVIIEIIEETHSQFFLTPEDEQTLSQAGVSKKVISVMHSTTDTSY